MVSASSLSSSGSHSDGSADFHYLYTEDGDRTVHRCHCDARLKVQRVSELENFGRRFVRCPYRQEFSCGYFAWVDPIFPTEATTIIMELLHTKSALEKQRTALVEKLNAKDVKIAMLEGQFAEAKGIAESLSESDDNRRKLLDAAHRQNRTLILHLKRHNILTPVLMALVSAAVWFLK